jgi:hypothetical protein
MRAISTFCAAILMTLAASDGAWAQSFTSLQFSNASDSPVTAWLTLGANSAGKVQDAKLVDVRTGQVVPVNGAGLQGSFTLQANQTVSWNALNGGVATGAVTFRAFPQSCPTPGGPAGVTKGEFAVNVGSEAVDVSSVDGINAIMAMDLSDGGATPWPSNPGGGGVAENSGALTGDKPAWGVFPYRCTQCAAIGDAPPAACNPLGPAKPSYCKDGSESEPKPVKCQLNRTGAGGVVKFIYKRPKDPT